MLIFERQQNSTNHPIAFFMALSSDHVSPATGKTPTIKLLKDATAGTAASASGAVTEMDAVNMPGWYSWAGNATDRNTLGDVICTATASGCDNAMFGMCVKAYDPWNVLPTANAGSQGGLATNDDSLFGTVTSGITPTTTTFTASGLDATHDNVYANSFLVFKSGTLKYGPPRKIAGYTAASGTLTFTNGFAVAPSAGDVFEIIGYAGT